jgi:hypothetical protein
VVRVIHVLVVSVLVVCGAVAAAEPAAAADVQIIYMNAAGSDANSGASPNSAVQSLMRVQELVAAKPLDQDVEVRIHAGTYVAGGVKWTTYRPGHTISFMPDDYTYGEGLDGIVARPVFENARASGSGRYLTGPWFLACPGSAGQPLAGGGTSSLRFYYLQVSYYANAAISVDGGATSATNCGGRYHPSSALGAPSTRGLDGNTIFGMRFFKLGNKYTGGSCASLTFPRCGYGGIVLTESSGNRIENNVFEKLENAENSYIHAIYVTHKSSHNVFSRNSVTEVSSGPIKLRDASNFNTFDSNTFGRNDFVRTSMPSPSHYLEEVNKDSECSSYHNRFTNNHLGTFFVNSTDRLPAWLLSPDGGATWPGAPGCPALPAGETRLTTAGNSY